MKFLVVVDMQEDFVNGVFGTDEAKNIIPYVNKCIQSPVYDYVIYTRDWHSPIDEHNNVEIRTLPPHCIAGTEGAYFVEDLIIRERAFLIDKETFGATGLEDVILDKYLWMGEALDDLEIHLVGLCTDICVISNALALRMWFPTARIVVNASGCAGTTPEKHLAALEIMKSNLIEVEYDV